MAAQKILVAIGGGVPTLVLDKRIVGAQIHRKRGPTVRAMGHKRSRNAQVLLGGDHMAYEIFVVPGLLTAGFAALEQAVVSLRVEEPLLVKARTLETMVHIRSQHKVVAVAHYAQELFVERRRYGVVSVAHNVAAPKRPVLLERIIGIEAAGIHIGKAVACGKVAKELIESLARIGVSGGGRESCSGTDYHGVRCIECSSELIDLFGAGCGRLPRQTREKH